MSYSDLPKSKDSVVSYKKVTDTSKKPVVYIKKGSDAQIKDEEEKVWKYYV